MRWTTKPSAARSTTKRPGGRSTTRRERAWLTRYIQAPDQVLSAGDPIATALFEKYKKVRMPNLRLSDSEVTEVLSYLENRSSAHSQARAQ